MVLRPGCGTTAPRSRFPSAAPWAHFAWNWALAQRKNDVEQKFTDITYLDGSRSMARPVSNYQSRTSTTIDDLTTRTLSLNAYYDFSLPGSRFTPYVGAGVGRFFRRTLGRVL